jgi:hypothetical protein
LDIGAHASKKTVECGKSSPGFPQIACDSSHIHSTVGGARSTLEKRGGDFGGMGQGDAQGHTRRSVGGSKQGSARSGAIEKYRLDRGA